MKSKWQNNNYLLFSRRDQLLTTTDVTSNSAIYEGLNGSANDGRKYLLSLMLWLVGVQCQTAPREMFHVFLETVKVGGIPRLSPYCVRF
jgi:hypothetical protein